MMKKYVFLLSLFLLFSNSLMALSECVIKSEEINSVLTSENKNVVDYTNKITTTANTDIRMYSNCAGGANMYYSTATNYCSNLVEGGYSDWRLPTLGEMAVPSGMGANGVPLCSGWNWTSTPAKGAYKIYTVWHDGTISGADIRKANIVKVRCVR